MDLTAAERVLVHLHAFWNAPEPGRERTQTGIAEGAKILRSHVPRALQALQEEGLVDSQDARLRGHTRKVRVYGLTEAGVRRARQLVGEIDTATVDVDGRRTTLGDARKTLGLSPLAALGSIDAEGRLRPPVAQLEQPILLQRDEDLAFLRRWLVGPAPLAVVYGSRGMGKTALGWAFARSVSRAVWMEILPGADLEAFARSLAASTGVRTVDPEDPESAADGLARVFGGGTKLLVVDGYGDVAEGIVDTMTAFLRRAKGVGAKALVLAQEATPAYCRFYGRKDLQVGLVAERHLRGLDLDGCRELLEKPDIDDEALRRIFLLTKGCPLYLRAIREGDEATLRAQSRFTKAEIRLLLYSGGAAP